MARRPQLDLFSGAPPGKTKEVVTPEPIEPKAPNVFTVGELARRIKGTLEGGLGTIHVRGEISNLRKPASGHLYFSLKDAGASLRAVLFRGQARLLRFRPENGQEVVARGRITFYEAGGDAQILCDTLDPVGAGALALAFDQLKAKLAGEGLFAQERKKPIPFLPTRIGVVTSPSGAAIRDFVQVLHRRFPGISVLVAPSRVQGPGSGTEIAEALRLLDARGDRDVIVVTRGGGSIEDLWAFNEEVVARAIVSCRTPVVSAVGHEVDFTIADFVADLRAPTPTGAAELLAPVESDLREGLAITRARLMRASHRALEKKRAGVRERRNQLGDPRRWITGSRLLVDGSLQRGTEAVRRGLSKEWRRLDEVAKRLRHANPAFKLQVHGRRLADLRERLFRARAILLRTHQERAGELGRRLWNANPWERIHRERGTLVGLGERLRHGTTRRTDKLRREYAEARARLLAFSPLGVLARGYAIAFTSDGRVVRSSSQVKVGDSIHLELGDGALEVVVKGTAKPRK